MIHTCRLNVRYAETDRMGVAHHSSYLLWFELARTGLLREAGYAYRDLERDGYLLPVVEYGCRLIKGAEYDDPVEVATVVGELRSRSIRFDYQVNRGADELVSGYTRHVWVDNDQRPRRMPDFIRDAVTPYLVR